MNKINVKLTLAIVFIAPGFLLITNFLPQEKKATYTTFFFILLICILNLFSKTFDLDVNKLVFNNNLYTTLFLAFVYLVFIHYTKLFVKFEIIDWDIPSYIVAINEIKNGYLPNETGGNLRTSIVVYVPFCIKYSF